MKPGRERQRLKDESLAVIMARNRQECQARLERKRQSAANADAFAEHPRNEEAGVENNDVN